MPLDYLTKDILISNTTYHEMRRFQVNINAESHEKCGLVRDSAME